MRLFANLFLILFFADGVISLIDELVSLLALVPVLAALRNSLADIVVVMAVPVYFGLGIDRRLPKRIFLPLVLFVFLYPLAIWLLPSVSGSKTCNLLAAATEVLLCILTTTWLRKTSGGSLLMTKEMFVAPFFSRRNTLIFGAANLVIMPVALVLLALVTVNSYLEEHTSGFMRLAPDGVHMTERIYRRADKTIRLAAMIHVGEKDYYDDLVGSVAPGRTIVLAEGVTDEENLLRDRLDYGKVAGILGLTSQETMQFNGRIINEDELDKPLPRPRAAGEGTMAERTDILRADVDLSSFRPQTIRFLNALGKQMQENASMVKGFLSFNAWAQQNITPQTQEIIMDDILYSRNKGVTRLLGKALERYDTIVIPWGALHMPEIEAAVLERGFKLRQERERVSITVSRIFRDKLSGPPD